MAVIRDMMPAFELFQPASIDEALSLLDQHKADVWKAGIEAINTTKLYASHADD